MECKVLDSLEISVSIFLMSLEEQKLSKYFILSHPVQPIPNLKPLSKKLRLSEKSIIRVLLIKMHQQLIYLTIPSLKKSIPLLVSGLKIMKL